MALQELQAELQLSPERLKDIALAFLNELRLGLNQDSSLLMLPTMVDLLPDGHERGEFYAIDFGGTNLRVLYTQLSEEPKAVDEYELQQEEVPEQYRRCHVDEVFNYIVGKLITFSASIGQDIRERRRPVVGFCFSFPVEQVAINSGLLIRWTKGFAITGGEGKDPVAMLAEAFDRQGLKPSLPALVNDTVATLAGTRYADGQDTNIAVIMGTGTNACYVEQLGRISKWMPRSLPRSPDMVVNIEWPGFASDAMPLLPEDQQLDAESSDPGNQRFEKLTSGLYLGDLARRLLLRVGKEQSWFAAEVPAALMEVKALHTKDLARIVQDTSPDLTDTRSLLQQTLGKQDAWEQLDVRLQVKDVCSWVAMRSARLVAAALSGLLLHLERVGVRGGRARPGIADHEQPHLTNLVPQAAPSTGALEKDGIPQPTKELLPPLVHTGEGAPQRNVVAADGRVFESFQTYRELLRSGISDILGEAAASNFVLKVTEGGAAFGAACLAAAAQNYMDVMGRSPPSRHQPARRRTTTE